MSVCLFKDSESSGGGGFLTTLAPFTKLNELVQEYETDGAQGWGAVEVVVVAGAAVVGLGFGAVV